MGRRLPEDEVIDAPLLTMRSIAQRFGNSREGIGRDGGIRTHDPLTPSQVRYQAALHPDMKSMSGKELGTFLPGVPHAAEALTNGFARSTILADGSLHPQLVP